jgi:hypothetical protein
MVETNTVDYVMKRVVLDKDKLNDMFSLYDTRRKIRRGQVRNLIGKLKGDPEDGNSFPPIAVNELEGKYTILDGNHRHDALKEYFALNENRTVVIWMMVYNIDTAEKIREKFIELNSGVKPSSDDLLQQHSKSNPFLMKLLRVNYISIYGGGKNPIKARVALTSYLNAIKPKFSITQHSSEDILRAIEDMQPSDINVIKNFLVDYEETFGVLSTGNTWLKTSIFQAMFRIWYQNLNVVPRDKMIFKFRQLINHQRVIELSKLGGREAQFMAVESIVEILNRTGKNYNFIKETPTDEEY